jgi:hypothetical protein
MDSPSSIAHHDHEHSTSDGQAMEIDHGDDATSSSPQHDDDAAAASRTDESADDEPADDCSADDCSADESAGDDDGSAVADLSAPASPISDDIAAPFDAGVAVAPVPPIGAGVVPNIAPSKSRGRSRKEFDLDLIMCDNPPTTMRALVAKALAIVDRNNMTNLAAIDMFKLMHDTLPLGQRMPTFAQAVTLQTQQSKLKGHHYVTCVNDCAVHEVTIEDMTSDQERALKLNSCLKCGEAYADKNGKWRRVSDASESRTLRHQRIDD